MHCTRTMEIVWPALKQIDGMRSATEIKSRVYLSQKKRAWFFTENFTKPQEFCPVLIDATVPICSEFILMPAKV